MALVQLTHGHTRFYLDVSKTPGFQNTGSGVRGDNSNEKWHVMVGEDDGNALEGG